MKEIATIGHSTHPLERFVELANRNGITAIADVRSSPYSRHNPQYNREPLKRDLKSRGIGYVFMGDEFGARSSDPADYDGDRVVYARLAARGAFRAGIERVMGGANGHRIALMCAEKDPITCHRAILVAPQLIKEGARIEHVLPDGSVEAHDAALDRLMGELGINARDLFASREVLVQQAYREQEQRIAYVRPSRETADA